MVPGKLVVLAAFNWAEDGDWCSHSSHTRSTRRSSEQGAERAPRCREPSYGKEFQMTKVTAVPSIELERYLGRWYEIARLPIKYEDDAATDITANYSLNDNGTIRVDNRCFNGKAKPAQAIGRATPIDDANSRLKVNFLPAGLRWLPFTDGDYWILKIDPEYRTVLVGTPDRKYLWVLAREPTVPPAMLEEYLSEARRQGFDLANLIRPSHTGREVTDAMISEA